MLSPAGHPQQLGDSDQESDHYQGALVSLPTQDVPALLSPRAEMPGSVHHVTPQLPS